MCIRGLRAALMSALVTATAYAQSSPQTVEEVEIRGAEASAKLVVSGSFAIPTYAVRARDEGRTVVLRVEDAELPEGGVDVQGSTQLVERVTASTTARGVQIEVSLAREAAYRARADHGRIRVHFEALSQQNAAAGGVSSQGRTGTPRASRGSQPRVRDVILERRNGRERVVVKLDAPVRFRVGQEDGHPVLRLRGAGLGEDAPRRLEGDHSSLVEKLRLEAREGDVFVRVKRRGDGNGTAIREGHRIVWLFAPDASSNRRPPTRTISRTPSPLEGAEGEEVEGQQVAAFLSDVPLQVDAARGGKRYTGRRIDLDFKDADIHNILRLLAEVGNVNIVTSDAVSGTVTIRMRNVPWDQALNVILEAKGLGMVRRGNLIRVAPQETLEKERELDIARRKQQLELAPLETRLIPVSYAQAESLADRVREMLTERGRVSVDGRTNMLVVQDVAQTLDRVEQLVQSLDTQTPQVLIEARIVEATSQFSRELGIQWGGDVTMSSATGNPTGLVFPHDVTAAGGAATGNNTVTSGLSPFSNNVANPNFAVNLPANVSQGQGGAIGLSLGSVGGNVNLNVRLSAAESSGIVRIISNPRILTLDNHEAHIAQGTLIPYSQVSAQGVQTAFQEAKLELQVRPHVTSDGSVSMATKITRDEPDFTRTSVRGDPTILKREAETNLLVDDGHTAVIGGIYTRNTGRNVNQVPFFGDIPILGVLFQHTQARDERNELLIFLTPRIVNRAEALRH